MELLIKFIMSTAGLTWILCDSSLLKPLRETITAMHVKKNNIFLSFLRQIFKCNGCMGVWAGMLCYVLVYSNKWYLEPFVFGFSGAFCGYALVSIGKYFERKV